MKKLFDSAPKSCSRQALSSEPEAMDIAVIGIAGKIAGATDLDQFWEGLLQGEDFITGLPENRRRDVIGYQEFAGMKSGPLDFKRAAFLPATDLFDHSFFNISLAEAVVMAPEQRMLLESVWHVLESAGYAGNRIRGSRTGIYLGYAREQNAYLDMVRKTAPETAGMAIMGNIASVMAGRIAHFLDLKGPTMLINTACSSSLVALHQACLAIGCGDCEMALVGGINLAIQPGYQVPTSGGSLGVESADGRARSFDDSSDGTGGGEGSIVLLLKPLKKALQDNDKIEAVIKGSAINQDGKSINIAAPNSAAQEDVIVAAWKRAGVDPLTVSYIEAHGTGTPLGDPIEIAGLTAAFRQYTDRRQFCAIGSVKSNIGHLDGAAGIAGMVKAILCLKHKMIAPTLHFEKPNRHIPFEESPFYLATRAMHWDGVGGVRRCGVSSFGISGTNAHVVLEEAPARGWSGGKGEASAHEGSVQMESPQLFVISATGPDTLRQLAGIYRDWLNESSCGLEDICYTSSLGRAHFLCRLAIIANSKVELRELIEAWLEEGREKIPDLIFGGDLSTRKGHIGFEQEIRELSQQAAQYILGEAERRREITNLERLAAFYVRGADINWEGLYRGERRYIAKLPLYPFRAKRCWIEIPERKQPKTTAVKKTGGLQTLPAALPVIPTGLTKEGILGQFKDYFSGAFDVSANSITVETSVYELGLDSITMVQVRLLIKKTYGIDIPVIDIFRKFMKLGHLSGFIAEQLQLQGSAGQAGGNAGEVKRPIIYSPDPRKVGKPVSTVRMADDGAREGSPAQRAYLDQFIANYQARTAASLDYTRENMAHFANNRNVSGFRKLYRRLHYTIIADRVEGSRIWDIDGNEYIDFAMGFGVFFMGHNHPLVREALEQQLTRGAWLGPLSRLTGEVATLIAELTGMERVAFYNSGTEAVMVAIRLARAATGRKKIVTFTGAYHGMFDGVLAQRNAFAENYEIVPLASGILQSMIDEVYVLEYDDPAALRFISEHAPEIAAVLVEPVQSRKPELQPREFLHDLRDITAANSVCLIFDEIITGFRVLPGGAQQYFGIKADLVTYGKVAGGGLPIGIVAGVPEYMTGIDGGVWDPAGDTLPLFDHRRTLVAGTFCHHPLALASAKATLQYLKKEGVALYDRINRMTTDFVSRVNSYFMQCRVPLRLYNFGTMFHFRSEGDLRLFFYHLIFKGIYVWEGATFFVSTVHSEEDLGRFETAIKETVRELQETGLMNAIRTEKIVPLTNEQFKIWLRSQESQSASAFFNELIPWYFQGELNEDALDQALKALLIRHEALRVRKIATEGQHIAGESDWSLPIFRADLMKNGVEASHRAAMAWIKAEVGRAFGAEHGFIRAFLVRYGPDRFIFGLIVHQVIADGYSLSLIQSELQLLYESYCGDGYHDLPTPERLETYLRVTTHQAGVNRDELLNFWTHEWEKPAPDPLVRDPFMEVTIHPQGCTTFIMPDTLYKNVRAMAMNSQTTPFVVLLAAQLTTAAELTGQKEILIGVPSVGQLILDNPCLVGQCMQMLPFRWTPEEGSDAGIPGIRDKLNLMQQYRDFRISEILEYTTSRQQRCHIPEIRIVFNQDPPIHSGAAAAPAETLNFRTAEGTVAKYDLFVNIVEVNRQLHCSFQYNAALFSDIEIRHWAVSWLNILQRLAGGNRKQWMLPGRVDSDVVSDSFTLPIARRPVAFTIEGRDGPESIKIDAAAYYRQLATLAIRLGFPAGTRIWLLAERLGDDELSNWQWMATYMDWRIVVGETPPAYSGPEDPWVICGDIGALTALRPGPESCHWLAARWVLIGSGAWSNISLKELFFPGHEIQVNSITRLAGTAWYLFHHSFVYKPKCSLHIIPAGLVLEPALVSVVTSDGHPAPLYAQGLLSIDAGDGKRVITNYHCTISGEGVFTIWSSGHRNFCVRGFSLDERLVLQVFTTHPQIAAAELRPASEEMDPSSLCIALEYLKGADPLLAPADYLKIFFSRNLSLRIIFWPGSGQDKGAAVACGNTGNEGLLLECIREALKRPEATLQDNFLETGGASIRAVHLVTLIRSRMGIDLKPHRLFLMKSMGEILWSANGDPSVTPSIPSAGDHGFYPLSFDQKRFWITEQLEDQVSTSLLVEARRVHGELDATVFYLACLAVVTRHESLRTIFVLRDAAPVQKILPAGEGAFDYRFEDWEGEPDPMGRLLDLRNRESQRPVRLEEGPLLRVRLIRISPGEYATILVTHHIIFDGWSSDVLAGDIITAYSRIIKGEEPFPQRLTIQLRDYCVWQNRLIADGSSRFRLYREKKFGQPPKPINFVNSSKRPAFKQQQAGAVELVIDQETTSSLHRIGVAQGATLFIVVHSTLLALVYNYSGETDMTIGIPVANRDHPDLQPLIGCLLNTMAVRTTFKERDSLLELLARVRADGAEAIEYKDYPLDLLLADMNYVRDPARNPLFDIGFTYHEKAYLNEMPVFEDPGIRSEEIPSPSEGVMADMWFNAQSDRGFLKFEIVYDRAIYSDSFMASLAENYRYMLQTFSVSPNISLQDWMARYKALQTKKAIDERRLSDGKRRQLLQKIKEADNGQ
jgi:glutamate-1-semialdehyde aminotransferase/3-oxoacyl-(acyl-carrier-protein) synthase/non-ribosomal peptide synthetase component F/acyl carrier protein